MKFSHWNLNGFHEVIRQKEESVSFFGNVIFLKIWGTKLFLFKKYDWFLWERNPRRVAALVSAADKGIHILKQATFFIKNQNFWRRKKHGARIYFTSSEWQLQVLVASLRQTCCKCYEDIWPCPTKVTSWRRCVQFVLSEPSHLTLQYSPPINLRSWQQIKCSYQCVSSHI